MGALPMLLLLQGGPRTPRGGPKLDPNPRGSPGPREDAGRTSHMSPTDREILEELGTPGAALALAPAPNRNRNRNHNSNPHPNSDPGPILNSKPKPNPNRIPDRTADIAISRSPALNSSLSWKEYPHQEMGVRMHCSQSATRVVEVTLGDDLQCNAACGPNPEWELGLV